MLTMHKKILVLLFVILLMAGTATATLFYLGNADRTYPNIGITCYLGRLYPGMPIYFCMWNNDGMDHSYFVNQIKEMNEYYTGWPTTTFTVQP